MGGIDFEMENVFIKDVYTIMLYTNDDINVFIIKRVNQFNKNLIQLD